MDWSSAAHTITLAQDEFDRLKHLPLRLTGDAVGIGERHLSLRDTLVCGDLGTVQVELLARAALRFHRLTGLGRTPQIAALLFDATGDPRFLDQYFPPLHSLPLADRADFVHLAGTVAAHTHLDVRLFAEGRVDRTTELARSARWIIAGYIVEALWERRDLLRHLLSQRRKIRLYTSEIAFEENSGITSSEYHPGRHSIDITLAQLYTGFYTEMPGVAPFLHGLAHLLDDCDARNGAMGALDGRLPGMGRHDGALHVPRVRDLFLEGKRLERDRYDRFLSGHARMGDTMPIGAPRLFHDDLEFVAGYFELFFRTPHYFAAQNPTLFAAYRTLLRQDPRRYWPRDCSFYVDQSRATYTAPANLPPAGIRVTPGWWPF